MADDMGERTEAPTPKRLADSRNKGQVPKSQDLGAAMLMGAGGVVIVMMGGAMLDDILDFLRMSLSAQLPGDQLTASSMGNWARFAGEFMAELVFPAMLVFFLIAFVAQFIQVGPLFTTHPLIPKPSKLNPIAGAKKLANKRNVMKTLLNSLKLVVVVAVGWLIVRAELPKLANTATLPLGMAVQVVGQSLAILALVLLFILMLLAVIDFIYQKWQHKQDLKMTKHQVKDERRSMDGDPQVKQKRFQMAREIAAQRIGETVPKADVVIANPTHFSIAIRYDAETMAAPKVVAKGVDHLALRIRQLARLAGVPVIERPPLARAIYRDVPVGSEIPEKHFQAVAELLAYVYRTEEKASA